MLEYPVNTAVPTQPGYQSLVQPIAVNAPSNELESQGIQKFSRQKAIGIGATLIVAAVASIVINCIDILVDDFATTSGAAGQGFWVGAAIILAGAFGIAAGRKKARGMIMTFGVVCIFAAVFGIVQFVISTSRATYLGSRSACIPAMDMSNPHLAGRCPQISAAMQAVLAALAVVEFALATYGSVLCFKAFCVGCCVPSRPVAQTVMVNNVPLTVIYQPRNHAISVAYPAVAVQPIQTTCQPETQNLIGSPPPYGNFAQATSVDVQTSDAASPDEAAVDYRYQEEKHGV